MYMRQYVYVVVCMHLLIHHRGATASIAEHVYRTPAVQIHEIRNGLIF